MKHILLIFTMGLFFQLGIAQQVIEKDFKEQFNKYGVDGCYVLYNPADNEYIKYNPNLCDSGYLPASTFKIPHSIIALEEKIVKDTNQIIKWDGHVWPNQPWNQDQTLKTAMKYSCVWVHIGFAEQIGIEKYQEYINVFDYGNKNLTGPPTRFWLAGNFRISANQQIDFLKKLYYYELPVSKESTDIVKDIIILEQTDNYKLSGKSGAGTLTDTELIIWLVGYIEKGDTPYFFAMNYKTENYAKFQKARYEITKDILSELKLIVE
ncbi:MAG: class D beta-lactamase [Bacteroidales bacterium]|nr:class D beta-lactamase [Bacteroidales bacterium]